MSISIQYRGCMARTAQVLACMEELADIAGIMGWSYNLWEEDWEVAPDAHFESISGAGIQIRGHSALRGICLYPHPNIEPLWLVFRRDGSLSSPFHIALDAGEGYPPRRVWLSTETGGAGPDTHMAIIRLLDYLNKRYGLQLEVQDSSGFSQTGDEVSLRLLFRAMNAVSAD